MSTTLLSRPHARAAAVAALLAVGSTAEAALIPIANPSFEDVTGLTPSGPSNEFFFGINPGWSLYDPVPIGIDGNGLNGIFMGTVEPAGRPWFGGDPAPDGDLVAILFGFRNTPSAGAGEYGLEQTLFGRGLAANTRYELRVDVGNIASGDDDNGTPFPLDGFPGYRVELLAGGAVIAVDDNTLAPGEGLFETSTISFTTGVNHALLGQDLGVRLVNLNQPLAGNDIEVDFDNVRLNATAVDEPTSIALLAGGLVALRRRRRQRGV